LGCTVVSTTTRARSEGFIAAVRVATAKALLQQRLQLLFAPSLTPARQRGAIKHQAVLEELLTAEVLEICRMADPLSIASRERIPPADSRESSKFILQENDDLPPRNLQIRLIESFASRRINTARSKKSPTRVWDGRGSTLGIRTSRMRSAHAPVDDSSVEINSHGSGVKQTLRRATTQKGSKRQTRYPAKQTFGCAAISVVVGQNLTHAPQQSRMQRRALGKGV
jgi:hypothetical protein